MIFESPTNITPPVLSSNQNHYISDIYTKPWCRISVYIIGMMTGYFLHVSKNQIKLNKVKIINKKMLCFENFPRLVSLYAYMKSDIIFQFFSHAVNQPVSE